MSLDVCQPRWREVGDPVADQAVAELQNSPGWVRRLYVGACNGAPETNPTLSRFFADHAVARCDARADARRRAAQWSERHLGYLSVSMLCGSLPILFLGASGAAVLAASERMVDDVDRRINATGAYVLDVVAPDGFAATGRALRASAEVRLIHALVRARLPPRDGEVSICQQDLVLTLLAFSVVPIRCTRRMGVAVDRRQAQDYYALWRALAPTLGIEPELVPADWEQAEAALDALLRRLREPSAQGRLLAQSLLDGMRRHLPIPGQRDAPVWMVRYLLGDTNADVLGIEQPAAISRTRWSRALGSGAVAWLAPRFGRRVHRAIVGYKLAASRSRAQVD